MITIHIIILPSILAIGTCSRPGWSPVRLPELSPVVLMVMKYHKPYFWYFKVKKYHTPYVDPYIYKYIYIYIYRYRGYVHVQSLRLETHFAISRGWRISGRCSAAIPASRDCWVEQDSDGLEDGSQVNPWEKWRLNRLNHSKIEVFNHEFHMKLEVQPSKSRGLTWLNMV